MSDLRAPWFLSAPSMDYAFVHVSRELLTNGVEREARGMKTLEIPHAVIHLLDPSRSVVQLEARSMNRAYMQAELDWYESGSLWVDDIAEHSKFWRKLADSNGTVNSNYGFLALVEKWSGMSQFEWCARRLNADRHTRQAVINYNQPRHKYEDNKDFVCTVSQSFMVREDDRLHTTVHMRSNDLVYGLTYDAPWFASLLARMCEMTGLPMGTYTHWAESLHAYERHFGMLELMAATVLREEAE